MGRGGPRTSQPEVLLDLLPRDGRLTGTQTSESRLRVGQVLGVFLELKETLVLVGADDDSDAPPALRHVNGTRGRLVEHLGQSFPRLGHGDLPHHATVRFGGVSVQVASGMNDRSTVTPRCDSSRGEGLLAQVTLRTAPGAPRLCSAFFAALRIRPAGWPVATARRTASASGCSLPVSRTTVGSSTIDQYALPTSSVRTGSSTSKVTRASDSTASTSRSPTGRSSPSQARPWTAARSSSPVSSSRSTRLSTSVTFGEANTSKSAKMPRATGPSNGSPAASSSISGGTSSSV